MATAIRKAIAPKETPIGAPPVGDSVARLRFQVKQAETAAANSTDSKIRDEHEERARRLRVALQEAQDEANFTALTKSVDIGKLLAAELAPIGQALEALGRRLDDLER